MVGVGWGKTDIKGLASRKAHFDKETRMKSEHGNTDINKELTPLNYEIGTSGFSETLKKLDARIKEVDAELPPIRVKKDRKTVIMLEVKCPETIPDERKKEFFTKAYEVIEKRYGSENVAGGFVHADEVHKYIDPHFAVQEIDPETGKVEINEISKERESLQHIHIFVAPFVPGKGINKSMFMKRGTMIELNNLMDKMCIQNFGVPYMKGYYTRKGRSIKSLKMESDIEAVRLEFNKAVDEKNKAEKERDGMIDSALEAESNAKKIKKDSEEKVREAKEKTAEATAEIKKAEADLAKIKRERDDLKYSKEIELKKQRELDKAAAEADAKQTLSDIINRARKAGNLSVKVIRKHLCSAKICPRESSYPRAISPN